MELVKVKYVGTDNIRAMMPGFMGDLKTGDTFQTTKENYESELKSNPDCWELVKEKKVKESEGV